MSDGLKKRFDVAGRHAMTSLLIGLVLSSPLGRTLQIAVARFEMLQIPFDLAQTAPVRTGE
ncbi:hypothetical protein [Candidatus Burkholderia verschuerenii]|uniref:hypothetical protein n=1 Tax=Candidatus Burkholderia verschuerenii TaxID=242163 RepID=UPI0012EE7A76|nr:hypothetical protein [Candidatus Burkholderia verschuerenii]